VPRLCSAHTHTGGNTITYPNAQSIADARCHALAVAFRVADRLGLPERVTDAIQRSYIRAVHRANALYWAKRNAEPNAQAKAERAAVRTARNAAANRHSGHHDPFRGE
jgi:hypothetical protein